MDAIWKKFDELVTLVGKYSEKLPGVGYSRIKMDCVDGHIIITGKFKSLKINGYRVNLPEKAMKSR